MVKEYYRCESLGDALARLASFPETSILAGGTFLLAGQSFGAQMMRDPASPGSETLHVMDVGRILPATLGRTDNTLRIGALCTFQNILESADAPPVLKSAAGTMANRNIRNRATVGGNLGANKTCASLIPLFLALEAEVEYAIPGNIQSRKTVAAWLAEPEGIVLNVHIIMESEQFAASLRTSRTACDLATSTASVVYKKDGDVLRDIRIALGGFGPRATRFPELESLFEGKPLPVRDKIEAVAANYLTAVDDRRGSAGFKKLRGAALLADALHEAEAFI